MANGGSSKGATKGGSSKGATKGGIKGYWRKRTLRRPVTSTVILGSASTATDNGRTSVPRRGRFWRIPKRVRFLKKIGSPRRWLARLRDAYVGMMLRIANSGALGYGYGCEYGCGYGGGDTAFGERRMKEYDRKMLVEIYKNMLISQGAAAGGGGAVAVASAQTGVIAVRS